MCYKYTVHTHVPTNTHTVHTHVPTNTHTVHTHVPTNTECLTTTMKTCVTNEDVLFWLMAEMKIQTF